MVTPESYRRVINFDRKACKFTCRFIATYHYFRIFNSWNSAFDVQFDADKNDYKVELTGLPFNDAYRYVDWLLTVPLLLIELILVMGLPAEETAQKAWSLGVASAMMVCLGYPGEIQDKPSGRWLWWFLAMIPFLYVVGQLAVGPTRLDIIEGVRQSVSDISRVNGTAGTSALPVLSVLVDRRCPIPRYCGRYSADSYSTVLSSHYSK